MKTTKLYGLAKSYHFHYLCLGRKCYAFRFIFGKKDKKLHAYIYNMTSKAVLYDMIHNSDAVKFVGVMRVPEQTLAIMFEFM